jgi:hypothetical protein
MPKSRHHKNPRKVKQTKRKYRRTTKKSRRNIRKEKGLAKGALDSQMSDFYFSNSNKKKDIKRLELKIRISELENELAKITQDIINKRDFEDSVIFDEETNDQNKEEIEILKRDQDAKMKELILLKQELRNL